MEQRGFGGGPQGQRDNRDRGRGEGPDGEKSEFQEKVVRFAGQVSANPLLQGVQVDDISFTASTEVRIIHRLNRTPYGWMVVGKDSFGDIRETARDSESLVLVSDSNLAASIWIY